MKILFLDQSGKLGGAELFLLDLATAYRDRSLVGLFADGSFCTALQQRHIPVQVLAQQNLVMRKESGFWQGVRQLGQVLPLIHQVSQLSRNYDGIYANTQKAFVVGAIASLLSRRPLIYHLHDILSVEHFSPTNLRLAVTLANHRATLVICNSQATLEAFVAAGGNPQLAHVVYNGFVVENYTGLPSDRGCLRQKLGLTIDWEQDLSTCFVVGHFSRLSPWKGQHILIEALTHCPDNVVALLVGDALFGETAYVEQLHQQIEQLGLQGRVKFLGFRQDVAPLMAACDLVAHTSTAPEPFGRVIVEAMLCGTPVVAAQAGGATELVESGVTGWLVPPGQPMKLAECINICYQQSAAAAAIAQRARQFAQAQFNLATIQQQIDGLLKQYIGS